MAYAHFGLTWLFAQQGDGAGDNGADGGGTFLTFPMMLVIMGALFWFMIVMPERRKRAKLKTKLEGIKKNDRVVTIGGIYGVVTNIRRDADEVALRVDEKNNTTMLFTISSIGRVLSDDDADNNDSGKK